MLKKNNCIGFTVMALTAAFLLVITPVNAVEFSISGQINRAVMYANDGEEDEWFFVDNDNSSTRFRFRGNDEFDNGWKVGILWEVEMQSNPSNKVQIGDRDDISNNAFGDVHFDERKIEFWVEKWGLVWLGQGDMASNGTAEVDLSGTDVAAYSSVDDVGGSLEFQKNNDFIYGDVGDSRSNFDGLSRRDRIRYDTPKLWNFYASGSAGNGNIGDVALRYAANWGFGKFAGAAAWASGGSRFDYDSRVSASASLLLNMGLNFTIAYGWQNWKKDESDTRNADGIGNDDPYNIFGKIGYKFLEKHAVSVQWSRTENLLNEDSKGDTWGIGYVFSPWKSVEFYAMSYFFKLEEAKEIGTGDSLSDPDDIYVGMIGGRVKF